MSDTRRRALQRLAEASSIADVARRANKDPAQLWGMAKGTRPFGERVARSLEISLGLPAGYFDQGEKDPNVIGIPSDNWKKVPLIDWKDAPNHSTAKPLEFVFTMQDQGENTFAVKIIDDSMTPTIKSGDIALIDPNYKPKPGNIVLVKYNDTPIISRYKQKSLTVFELCPDNDNYPAIFSNEAKIKIIGTVYQMLVNTI